MDNTIPTIEPSLDVIVRRVHTTLGGRATIDQVLDVLQAEHSDVFAKNARSAMKGRIRDALTEHGSDGMPFAGSIENEYVQRGLFVAADYEVKIGEYVARAGDNLDVAVRLADECAERYGIRFAVPSIDSNPAEKAS